MILYRIALTLGAPFVVLFLLWQLLRGRETRADLGERLGLGTGSRGAPLPDGPLLWLHGASNGELTAARPLAEALLAASPDLRLLITANTRTARSMASRWGLPRTDVRLAPLDYRPCIRSLLARHKATAIAVIENELWPNRLAIALDAGLPVALVGARMSERSAARWQRASWVLRPVLARITLAMPQDGASARALAGLGVQDDVLTAPVALKAAVALERPSEGAVAALGYARADTLLAASTHAGEETQVFDAYLRARALRPDLRLILAPRHPARASEIAALIAARGLRFSTRSAGEAPGDSEVYLADTMGEMPLWYAAAGLCFVGGSLVEKGGHTPFEPAQFGCAILTGPHVENAATAFARLQDAGAVRIASTAAELGDIVGALTAEEQDRLGADAQTALAAGDIAPLAERLADALRLRPTG